MPYDLSKLKYRNQQGGENSPAAFFGFATENSTSMLYLPHYSNNQAVEAHLHGLVR